MKKQKQLLGLLFIAGFGLSNVAAQTTDSIKTTEIEETVIIGSRNKNRIQTDVPAPVDVFNVSDIITTAPQNNLSQILNYVAPSFSSNPVTIGDGTDHSDPAQLRGLGPDQVLVLLNGKRRHTTALVNISGSSGRGSVGTDLNAIPAFAIDKIEVLRDGAAAQYGSDAIAGVININLKKNKGFSGALQYGGNFSSGSNDFSGGVDGQQVQLDLNYGKGFGNYGGFFNISATALTRENTSRAGIRNGNIFNAYNAIERVAGQNGVNLSSLFENINNTPNQSQIISYIKQFAPQVGYFSQDQLNSINNANSISALQSALNFDVTNNELKARGQKRSDYNMKVGQAELATGQIYFNSKIPFNDVTSLYTFGGLSYRNGTSYAFNRLPNSSGTTTSLYPDGYLPEIHSDIYDFSQAIGLNTQLAGFDVDISSNLGTNSLAYNIENTANATLGLNSPKDIYAGRLSFLQNTNNVDFSRNFDVLEGLNIAFGGEFRYENFQIEKGDEASYEIYDINGNPVNKDTTAANEYVTDFFGNRRGGGSQAFSGFQPENETNKSRRSGAGYLDVEFNPFKQWLLTGAVRYENYSDFGGTTNYKLATLVKVTPNFNLRASGQTGFRAPSLQQKYFSTTSTLFFTDTDSSSPTAGLLVPKQVAYFVNESEAANILGIPKLKPEKSKSISAGFTYKIPSAKLTFTVDAYFTRIDDRVILTGTYARPTDAQVSAASGTVQDALKTLQSAFDTANGAERATFFTNGINTETKGIDAVISHRINLADNISIKSDLAGSYFFTQRVGDLKLPETLLNGGDNEELYKYIYFPESSKVYLENAIPRFKANLSNTFTFGKFEFFMRNSYFGKVTDPGSTDVDLDGYASLYEHPEYSGKLLTDLSVGYQINKNFRVTVGANNVGDVYPDYNPTFRSFTNTTSNLSSAAAPSTDLSNQNQFVYSRAVSQFGQNGRYLFARINFKF